MKEFLKRLRWFFFGVKTIKRVQNKKNLDCNLADCFGNYD